MNIAMKPTKYCAALLIAAAVWTSLPQSGHAQTKQVSVAIPTFQVSLNGIQVDNAYRQYPLLVYKDITYFPMTYYDSRFLGLVTKWDSDQGLEIEKTGISAAYRDYKGSIRNAGRYTASIPDFAVRINGKNIIQSEEVYPLLEFRDVTYFPLTWRFAAEELEWSYRFDAREGFVIESSNPQVEPVALPGYAGGEVVAAAGSYYYGGAEGEIFQASIEHPDQAKKVYQLPIWSYGDGKAYVSHGLTRIDGEVWLRYHQGGAIMGSDHYIKLKSDGTYDEAESGYLNFKTFGSLTVKVWQGVPPSPDNLRVKEGDGEYRSAGDPAYLYGWNWNIKEGSAGGAGSRKLYMDGRNLYTQAYHMKSDTDFSRLHRVDVDTGETTRVSDLPISDFILEGKEIYALSERKLYRIPVQGGAEELLPTTGTVSSSVPFELVQDTIYYVDGLTDELHAFPAAEAPLNPGGKVAGMKVEDGYLLVTFKAESGSRYGLMVWDADRRIAFATSDSVAHASIDKCVLTYVESESSRIYRTVLAKNADSQPVK
ncbi:hypothetical protein [Paenibacillus puerhi]|uniref:hypothetical protein n=1 Tax=Paenibacillus puerhi TaxID=2692622 RepID=UPI00135A3D1F|nr:hypothetical protein [Paenibacillus puerhi]